ncbi:MAG: hypothetical protein LBO65_05035 [Spirochaetaceae bacterium]|nr:hypothetical protein [Spirochaetaceae bacterium]
MRSACGIAEVFYGEIPENSTGLVTVIPGPDLNGAPQEPAIAGEERRVSGYQTPLRMQDVIIPSPAKYRKC